MSDEETIKILNKGMRVRCENCDFVQKTFGRTGTLLCFKCGSNALKPLMPLPLTGKKRQ